MAVEEKMPVEENIADSKFLKELYGAPAFLYRLPHKFPYIGELGGDKEGLPAISLEGKIISLRNLDILTLGSADIVYLDKKGI